MAETDTTTTNATTEAAPVAPAPAAARVYHNDREGCELFVGNLPFRTPWQDLKDQFSTAGSVRYADLIADRDGRPRGSAIVTMSTPADAQAAIKNLHDSNFGGRQLIVRPLENGPKPRVVQKERQPFFRGGYASGGAGGYGGYGPPAARGGYGSRGGVAGALPGAAGRGRGGAAPGGAAAGANGDDVPKPRSKQTGDSGEIGRRLFISNLPFTCTSEALKDTFSQIGPVERGAILQHPSGKSRGLGIIVMSTPEEAATAVTEFHGIEMVGRPMNVRLDRDAQ